MIKQSLLHMYNQIARKNCKKILTLKISLRHMTVNRFKLFWQVSRGSEMQHVGAFLNLLLAHWNGAWCGLFLRCIQVVFAFILNIHKYQVNLDTFGPTQAHQIIGWFESTDVRYCALCLLKYLSGYLTTIIYIIITL